MRPLQLAAAGVLGAGGLAAAVFAALWLAANGLTVAGLALGAVAASLLLLGAAAARSTGQRALAAGGLALLGLGAAWAAARWARPLPAEAWAVCSAGGCAQPRFGLGRLVPEAESVRAGLLLARLIGVTRPDEARAYEATVERAFAALPEAYAALPNPGFALSAPGAATLYVRRPPAPRRCLVFLHGFGGLMTPYLEVLARAPLGTDALVVAPALDPVGAWNGPRGAAVVRAALDFAAGELGEPCWLIGLSNGAVGAWHLPAQPELRARVQGAVLLSGLGDVAPAGLPAVPTLVVSGVRDARFPWEWLLSQLEPKEREVGAARLSHLALEADHFLILSEGDGWNRAADAWITAARSR